MACKDDKSREAPGYCVECDQLRALTHVAVCETCWKTGPCGEGDRQEDPRCSAWDYVRLGENAGQAGLKPYVFVTDEGFTYQPGSESAQPDVENLQVLGIAYGPTPSAAFQRLLQEQPWIAATSFSRTFCWELAPDFRNNLHEFQIP